MDCCSPWSIVQFQNAAGKAGSAFWKYQMPAMKWWSAVHAEVIINLSIKQKSWLHKLLIFFSSVGASGSNFLVLAPTWKGPASTNKWCAVLCCLGASTVVLLKLQWSIWHVIATSINVICNICMMHIYGIAAGQWDLILRGCRQRDFRLGKPFQGSLFPTSSMPNRATFSRSSLLLPTLPMRSCSTSVQHNALHSSISEKCYYISLPRNCIRGSKSISYITQSCIDNLWQWHWDWSQKY